MPLMLRTLEDKCGVDKRVAKFVVPIGVTVSEIRCENEGRGIRSEYGTSSRFISQGAADQT